MKILLKNGRVIDPANKIDKNLDVLLAEGKIAALGENIAATDAKAIDVEGKIVTPGLIDMHVHFREPGQEAKEDFLSGSRAAAAGGFTTVATMPNTSPAVDTAALVNSLKERARDVKLVNIEIIGALTKGQKGEELAEVLDMSAAGAVAFSDDGHFVKSAKLMLNALDYLQPTGKIIICHEEESSLVEEGVMNEGRRSALLGFKGRPAVAEDIAVARDILLAEYAQSKVHVAHLSSGRAAQLVREAKGRGVKVTCEVTPQHLTLTEDVVDFTDSSTKINPPLRTAADNEALLAALKDGTIDMIVTDHSPHAPEEKDREFIYAPSGFPGLETALGVLLTDLYHTGKIELSLLIEKMTAAPAQIFNLPGGTLTVGSPADVTVIDLEKKWLVEAKKFYTKGSHSPFVGRELTGKAVMTFVGGRLVMEDGEV